MDEKLLREMIQKKLRSGDLPYEASAAPIVGGSGGSGQMCAACDESMKPSDMIPIGYDYLTGKRYWFHKRCEELWAEERVKVHPRN